MNSIISRIGLLIFLAGCASATITKDLPEELDGFLRLPWGMSFAFAQDQMLARPQVILDSTSKEGIHSFLVFRNVTFLGIPVDKCDLIFYEHGGLSDVRLHFLQPEAASFSMYDSLRASIRRVFGPSDPGGQPVEWAIPPIGDRHIRNRIEWAIRPIRGGYVRNRSVTLGMKPDGSILLHAHADYEEIRFQ